MLLYQAEPLLCHAKLDFRDFRVGNASIVRVMNHVNRRPVGPLIKRVALHNVSVLLDAAIIVRAMLINCEYNHRLKTVTSLNRLN